MRGDSFLKLTGWVETGGKVLSREEILSLLHENPLALSSFGGEFLLEWDDCCARDALGIIPGPVPPGKILLGNQLIGSVEPRFGDMGLEEAIVAAVALRSDRGVVALSGGVDSALVAAIARRPCIAAGTAESGDLVMGMGTARDLGLECIPAVVAPGELEGAVAKVIGIVPEKTPLDLSIALSWYFVTRSARDAGYDRVITGQGADELFGGYRRYLESADIDALLADDFSRLPAQVARDQSVAMQNGVLLSYPYLDGRVVSAARALPAREKVAEGVRKRALREVAERFLPREVAWREKKAMQYGTGIWRELQRLARRKGFPTVKEYLARAVR